MHPFIPRHDEVYTILKTIIWYFFNAICFVFNATNIYFCIVVSFKKRLQTCTTWIEFSFHSVCLDVRPYYGAKIILNMQFSFCNYRQWWSSWGPAKKSPVILHVILLFFLPFWSRSGNTADLVFLPTSHLELSRNPPQFKQPPT